MYKIIWALDPFDSNFKLRATTFQVFERFIEKAPTLIQPVYTFSEVDLDHFEDLDGPYENKSGVSLQKYRDSAQRAAEQVVSSVSLREIQKPQLLLQSSPLAREGVDLLSDYAYLNGANLILVNTHGRSGISRLLLGSFAETLVLRSKVPVLVVGPQVDSCNLESVLFPTDFGVNSKAVFRRAIGLVREVHPRLTLFHSIPHPIEPLLQSGVSLLGGGNWVPSNYYFSEEMEHQLKRANCWARWASHQGVPSKSIVNTYGGPISDCIISLAKHLPAGVILIEEQSGPIAAALIGSITRQVIRTAHCPVWVVRANMPAPRKIARSFGAEAA